MRKYIESERWPVNLIKQKQHQKNSQERNSFNDWIAEISLYPKKTKPVTLESNSLIFASRILISSGKCSSS